MTSDEPLKKQLDLRDYLAILERRKWVIVLSVLTTTVVAFALSVRQADVYSASAEVLLNRQSISNIVTGVSSPDIYTDPTRFMETQAGLARAPEVAQRTVELANVPRSAATLLASSSVSPKSNADLLRFTVQDGDPDVATALVNAYARAFTAYKADLEIGQVARARKELEARIAEMRKAGNTESDAFQELVGNAQQLRTMELLQNENIVVRPSTGAGQIAPTPRRNAVLGAFLGLLLGIGMAFLWEALDKRVRHEEEIEATLGLSLLGRLPSPARGESALEVLEDPRSRFSEAAQVLATNLEFANADREAAVIMVTSSVESEGKTTTSANLGAALAQAGKNVVVVDLDLRRPALHKFFRVPGRRIGITDVALRHTTLDSALVPIALDPNAQPAARRIDSNDRGSSLFVLQSGRIPASPAEFMGTEAVRHVLEELRERFDYVIVDSAPLLPVGDSLRLSAFVDGVVVVTRLGVVDRSMLRDLDRVLSATPVHKLGIVLTGAANVGAYRYGYDGTAQEPTPNAGPTGPTPVRPLPSRRPQEPARSARRTTG